MNKIMIILALALVPGITGAADTVDFNNPQVMQLASAVESVQVPLPEFGQVTGNTQESLPPMFRQQKIVGGTQADRGEFPFIVSLQSGSYGHFCGGSLIRKNWILTAAHCVEGGYLNSLMIGLHNLNQPAGSEKFASVQVVKHPNWNSRTMDYDFALVRFDGESKFAPISLNSTELSGGVDFITAGWGTTSENGSVSNTLMKVAVPMVSHSACNTAYRGQVTDSMICAGYQAGGKDSCQGDSGGPLVMGSGSGRYLAGVVSWGEGCARPNKYGVYSKVSAAISWINSVVR